MRPYPGLLRASPLLPYPLAISLFPFFESAPRGYSLLLCFYYFFMFVLFLRVGSIISTFYLCSLCIS